MKKEFTTMPVPEVLKIVNTYMEKSGVRKYCREICKGHCCRPCGKKGEVNCEENLPCVSFVCGRLMLEVSELGYSKEFEVLKKLASQSDSVNRKIMSYKWHQRGGGRPPLNPYFCKYDVGMFMKEKIDVLIPRLYNIRKCLRHMIKNKITWER